MLIAYNVILFVKIHGACVCLIAPIFGAVCELRKNVSIRNRKKNTLRLFTNSYADQVSRSKLWREHDKL